MKKRFIVPIAAVAFVGLLAAFATTAQAYPSKTTACTICHDGVNVPVTATLVSTVGTTATYTFSSPAADTVAVFDGATKKFTFNATSGQFAVTTGKTYTIYAVAGPGTGDGLGSTTVSPPTAIPDTTAPATVSNAVATYVSSASIRLTATDAGSGVAATYYKLDGGAQVSGTTVNVTAVGSHTIEFWSVDVAGNIETHKTASFSITAPVPVPTPGTYTVRLRITPNNTRGRVATLTNTVTGAKFTAIVGKFGNVVFAKIPAGSYKLTVTMKTGVKFIRNVTVSAPDTDDDDDDDDDSRDSRAYRWLLAH